MERIVISNIVLGDLINAMRLFNLVNAMRQYNF